MKYINISKERLRKILIATIILLIAASIEILMISKDYDMYLEFKQKFGYGIKDYNAINVLRYFVYTIIYVIYAIMVYLSHKKGFFTRITKWTFNILLFSSILMKILQMDFSNVFFYIQIISAVFVFYQNATVENDRGN